MFIDDVFKEEEANLDKKSFFEKKFIEPKFVIDQLDFKEGMKVADFGCGAGYFTLPIAEKVKETGVVYAFDVVSQKLEAVNSQARIQSVNNIKTKRVNLENENGSELSDESIDWVVMKDILFQNKNKEQILNEARRILKVGGKILIVEWKVDNFSIGPEKSLRIYKESLVELARKNSLTFIEEVNAGNYHYGLVLGK